MKGNKKSLLVVVLLVLVGLTSAYVAYSYAKYTDTVTGNNGTVKVAKWAFTTDNVGTANSIAINLAETYHATTLVNGTIAPGTRGSFDVAVNNANSEVGVNFEVGLDAISNLPKNLKFYSDSSYNTEIVPGTGKITGVLEAKDGTDQVVHFYWRWLYETAEAATNDPLDTADGEAAKELTIAVTITGTQVAPGTTAISSHVNQ